MKARDWQVGDVWSTHDAEIVSIERGPAMVWRPGREVRCADAVIVTWAARDPHGVLWGPPKLAYHPDHESHGGLVRPLRSERAA